MKAIIFDKDGTLMAFDPFWAAVANAALSKLSLRLGVLQHQNTIKESIGLFGNVTEKNSIIQKGTYEQAAEAINGVLKDVGSPVKLTGRKIEEIFLESAIYGVICPTCEGIPALMKRLREHGFLLFLVTTDAPAITYRCLDGLEIAGYFHEIITDDGKFAPKPDPSAIHYLLKKYKLQQDEICMVGDTDTDMCFAKNGGIMGIRVGGSSPFNCGEDILIPDVSCLEKALSRVISPRND